MEPLKSILGYSANSPYRNEPYLDIFTPEGLIDMSNTPKDLMGIDNLGNIKKMKANSKNPYKFDGDTVREIPINPYMQSGGVNQILSYLFDDDDEEDTVMQPQQIEEVDQAPSLEKNERLLHQRQEDDLAMEQANMSQWENPYRRSIALEDNDDGLDLEDNTYSSQISSGKWGNENIGQRGRHIIGEVTNALGYTPTFNSIYRDPSQQQALVNQGVGAKNSYHLTGDAVDMKPQDWNKLSDDKKQYFRSNYDVVYHNNHYHIEPKD